MKVGTVKRIAAGKLKIGESRVWIDMNSIDQLTEAATRQDVYVLIRKHVIQEKPKKGNSNSRHKKRVIQRSKDRRRGPGSVRGTRNARLPRKERWVKTIRALRDELSTLKENKKIDDKTYRHFYRLVKGGSIKSRSQLRMYLKLEGGN
ncbi:MAG: 50S ribosomal protein L19e [Candidatus Thermoplasmatota archaeon]|jgi:large subunit ribosomal protein L19e|nr:50S ribosomal protein L19e [Candidatus Thermoplasmatota archaeon]